MRMRITIIGALIIASMPIHAAVIVHTLQEPLKIFNTDFPIDLFFPHDVDGNGTADFSFTAFRSHVGLRTERSNRLVITIDPPPNIGGSVASLSSGKLIGLNSLDQDAGWLSSDILEGYVSPDELTTSLIIQVFFSGHFTHFKERSTIGIEFEAEDGIHYGYFDIAQTYFIDPNVISADITLYGWAWETEPGKAILAGQVPEPSALILFGLATTAAILSRRNRG